MAGVKPFKAMAITLFPDMFPGPLGLSLAGKAIEEGIWTLETVDIRDFASDKHRTADDSPFGGGAGMVIRPDVLEAAVAASHTSGTPLIYVTPRGRLLEQSRVRTLAAGSGMSIICGRYEGIDERFLEAREVEEVSLGDFVLSGGEPAAIVLIDAVVRLLPGVVSKTKSLEDESFETGLLEYPHYTRPDTWGGREVPEVLKSGHHAKIQAWRRMRSEEITRERRPDLWARYKAGSIGVKK
ncbi:MAG TPA: tRNA (guanosine(37)-N1)-methyltransferase TrmD [Rhodospirillaceae bacterium]|nr:tRNA (guanosine(37)-N1)-methyltransferase TrmD [Rhodospirillaceae bacterium]